ncbi:hypothetical protein ACQ4PT_012905 [Festuca glaucescens]
MAKQLICSLVLLVTLSGARVKAYPGPEPNCQCPPPIVCRARWDCDVPCIAPGCGPCLLLRVCDGPPPAPVDSYDGYSLFAFGDSFADNGNTPETPTRDLDRELIRSWYTPYANSYGNDDGSFTSEPNFTGRYSNYMVQSDFVAKMLGIDMAPKPHKKQGDYSCDSTGMTFATAGSGVYSVPEDVPSLTEQVDTFANLINSKLISTDRLAKSVALVAISGNDYDRVGVAMPSSFVDVSAFIRNVTSAISDSVLRLRALGVPKVLVNNLHPVGCTPAQTRASNHSGCDGAGNGGAVTHNQNLARLMDGKDGVLIVDLHSAFKSIVDHPDGEGSVYSSQFKNKLTPCCQGIDANDLCADTRNGENLYQLCDNPKQHFYWDEMHPSQTGWAAVMALVEGPIKQFVGIA